MYENISIKDCCCQLRLRTLWCVRSKKGDEADRGGKENEREKVGEVRHRSRRKVAACTLRKIMLGDFTHIINGKIFGSGGCDAVVIRVGSMCSVCWSCCLSRLLLHLRLLPCPFFLLIFLFLVFFFVEISNQFLSPLFFSEFPLVQCMTTKGDFEFEIRCVLPTIAVLTRDSEKIGRQWERSVSVNLLVIGIIVIT